LIHNFLGLVIFLVSKQDGLVWGNPVTSVITRPTLKPFSSTHGLTKTTSEFRPNHRETKYKFDKQGGGVQNSYLFTFFYIYFFSMIFFSYSQCKWWIKTWMQIIFLCAMWLYHSISPNFWSNGVSKPDHQVKIHQ
jgi:hypothetical protein